MGIVLCAVALTVAFPLRGYLEQRSVQAAAAAEQVELQAQKADLEAQVAALQDPDHIRTEARRRLQYVSPGDTVFTVHAPGAPVVIDAPVTAAPPPQSWYSGLWETVTEPAAAPNATGTP
nr:septum formation initiator family protein [Nakamurella flavida]